MRRLLPLGIALSAVLAGVLPADAKPPGPPVLTAAYGTQRGEVASETTDDTRGRKGDLCVVDSGIMFPTPYPDPVAHDGSALTWRIADRRRPLATTARVVTDLPVQAPARERKLPVTVAPVTERGKVVAWIATAAGVGYGDLHLHLDVRWKAGMCGGDRATYTYRLLSLPTGV